MTHILKMTGFAAVAALALTGAVAASAQAMEFHSAVEPAKITISADGADKTGHQVFQADGMTITCTTIKGEVTIAKSPVPGLNINETLENCTALGTKAFVKMNECTEDLNASTGYASFTCPEGKQIEMGVEGICVVKVGPQENAVPFKFHNIPAGEKKEVTIEAEPVAGVNWKAQGAFCPEGKGEGNNGELVTGNRILTGEEDKASPKMTDFWVA